MQYRLLLGQLKSGNFHAYSISSRPSALSPSRVSLGRDAPLFGLAVLAALTLVIFDATLFKPSCRCPRYIYIGVSCPFSRLIPPYVALPIDQLVIMRDIINRMRHERHKDTQDSFSEKSVAFFPISLEP